MKVLGVCGSPVKNGNTAAYLEAVLEAVKDDEVEINSLSVAELAISDCRHCNFCLTKQTREHICSLPDDMPAVYPRVLEADVLVFASPVYLMRLSGYLARFMDRLRALLHGKVYRNALRDKVGVALAVSWFRNTGLETTLLSVLSGMVTLGMIPVGGIGGLGAGAVSSRGGTGMFDRENRLGVLEDEYGLETGRKTIQRAVELARIIKAGKQVLAGGEKS
ncbi:MAG: flavodoxin family protein [Bacillota bacterium]